MAGVIINDEGVAENVVVAKINTPRFIVSKLAKKREISMEFAEELLAYNVFTPMQIAAITGRSINTITSHLRVSKKKDGFESKLKRCHPFPDICPETGPKFVYRDSSCDQYIHESLGID